MPVSLRKHLISMACNLLSNSTVGAHDSQAYKMDMTKARIRLIIDQRAMFLFFPDGFEFCERCYGLSDFDENFRLQSCICDNCSQIFEAVYRIKDFSFSSRTLMSVLMPLIFGHQFGLRCTNMHSEGCIGFAQSFHKAL
ncbi:hypothetical protein DPMN_062766 [Dreissena polymorpha]|uniref:Uncharacterized protein n=1 Tax=Dreissena polymorpha TaxID=45954 RepID=A0A9D4HIF2_DREPO|nr:hypothetical protein DPMN_062766 [Dreissena polymorpha]